MGKVLMALLIVRAIGSRLLCNVHVGFSFVLKGYEVFLLKTVVKKWKGFFVSL